MPQNRERDESGRRKISLRESGHDCAGFSHGPVQYDKFIINYSPTLRGDLSSFGDHRRFIFENDRELIDEIITSSRLAHLPVGLARELELDHGVLVPLYYLMNEKDLSYNPRLIHMSFSMLPLDFHFRFGEILGKVLQGSPKTGLFHCQRRSFSPGHSDAPAGYSPQGRVFDRTLAELIQRKNTKGVLNLDPYLIEEAGECGFS